MKTCFLIAYLLAVVGGAAWALYRVIWSPRHRKFRALGKEFDEIQVRYKATVPNSKEAWACVTRMGEIVKEQGKLLHG